MPRSTITSERSTSRVRPSTGRPGRAPRPVTDDRVCDRRRPAAGEHRQPAQQPVVVLGQEVPAPVDERVERLLARDRGPAAAGEQPEPVTEPLRDVVRRHRRDPRRGELDRERDPVEPPADLRDRRDVGIASGRCRGGALHEQPDRLGRRRLLEVDRGAVPTPGRGGGRSGTTATGLDDGLARDRERLAAGRQDPWRGGRRGGARRGRRRLDEVLGVVEEEEHVLAGEERGDRRRSWGRPARVRRGPGRPRRDLRRLLGAGASSTSHTRPRERSVTLPAASSIRRVLPVPPTPMSVTSRWRARSASSSASSSSRPTKRGQLDRQVRPARAERPERREVPRRSATATWKICSGRSRSRRRCDPRSMSSMSGGAGPVRGPRRRPTEDLPAVTDGEDPRVAVERRAEVVTVPGSAAPAWIATRTRSGPVAPHETSRSPRPPSAAVTAAPGRRTPRGLHRPRLDHGPAGAPRWRRAPGDRGCARAAPIASPCSSQSRVLPSMSVSRNVEIGMPPNSYRAPWAGTETRSWSGQSPPAALDEPSDWRSASSSRS